MTESPCFVRMFVACGLMLLGGQSQAQTNLSIYADQLANGFQDWSWGTHDLANASPVHSGIRSIAFTSAPWNAVSFWHSDFNPAPYTNLNFWVNGGASGGQVVQVYLEYSGNSTAAYQLPPLPTNSWRQFILSFSTLNAAGITNLNRINFQLTSSGNTNAFYLDDVNLTAIPPALVRLSINAADTVRDADDRWFGLNTAIWDSNFDTPETSTALTELSTKILRFPGGSASDEYHWMTGRSLTNNWAWATRYTNFVHIATNIGAQAMITVNYGTGTTNEAAAWVKSANVTNHLGFRYWEIGNECYGGWETDSNNLPHDPYTYAVRARDYITQMKLADPTIKIGVVAVTGESSYSNNATHSVLNPRTGSTVYGWTPIVLSTLKSLGATPDFLVHHVYPEWTDKNNPAASPDNDQLLLASTGNWAADAADLRQQIADYFGSGGTNIELLVTENNSDAGAQGKQSTSLVNGLYLADSLAQLMKTEFNAFIWWDLRNGTDYEGYFGANVYGWRNYGDLGVINGLNTRHPVFHTFKLMQYFACSGDTVLSASTDYPMLPVYSARKADGSLAVLVINKDNVTAFNAQLSLASFLPWTNAVVRSYGVPQDEAARTNAPAVAQDISTSNLLVNGTNINASFAPYSVTVLTFPPAAPQLTIMATTDGTTLQVLGQSKVRYILQSSTNLTTWSSTATNILTGSTWSVTNNASEPVTFWRAIWQPL